MMIISTWIEDKQAGEKVTITIIIITLICVSISLVVTVVVVVSVSVVVVVILAERTCCVGSALARLALTSGWPPTATCRALAASACCPRDGHLMNANPSNLAASFNVKICQFAVNFRGLSKRLLGGARRSTELNATAAATAAHLFDWF